MKKEEMEKRDCIIVCGYPANEDGTISNILKSRIDMAIDLYTNHYADVIIVSGGAIHNAYYEAKVMKEYAMEQGIPSDVILLEDKAKSTYHNMMYARDIMKQYQYTSCFVVTNSWHKIKAEYYAKKFHLDYKMINSKKPEGMSIIKVWILTLYMPINMWINRLKGFK